MESPFAVHGSSRFATWCSGCTSYWRLLWDLSSSALCQFRRVGLKGEKRSNADALPCRFSAGVSLVVSSWSDHRSGELGRSRIATSSLANFVRSFFFQPRGLSSHARRNPSWSPRTSPCGNRPFSSSNGRPLLVHHARIGILHGLSCEFSLPPCQSEFRS